MFILDRRSFLAVSGGAALAGATGVPARAAPSSAQVFTADASAALVDSVVIVGEDSTMLIDAQFNAASANALADVIEATGKPLGTILITHMHPDHHLGLGVIMDRFPDARPVAHSAIQEQLAATAEGMLAAMSSGAPAGAFADRAVVPDPLPGDILEFEGERLDLIGPIHGDTDLITPVHIPALDTVVASDVVYTGTHAWVAENTTPDRVALWRDSLDQLEALGTATIIPGHRQSSSANDASAVAHTRAYLDQWEAALAATSSAEELKAAMMDGNEDLGLAIALDRAVAAVYPG